MLQLQIAIRLIWDHGAVAHHLLQQEEWLGWEKGGAGALLKEAGWLACEAVRCGTRCGLMEVKRRERRAAYMDSLHV
jgi:hypothetical protein